MRSRRSGSCTWGGEVTALLLPFDGFWAFGKARNVFRAGARVTFFGTKKVTKENFSGPGHICHRRRGRDFSTRPPCLIEKRRASCASPSGSAITLRPTPTDRPSTRSALDIPWNPLRPDAQRYNAPRRPGSSRFADPSSPGRHDGIAMCCCAIRFDAASATARRASIGHPEGDAQDVRRFSTRQDASSKNAGHFPGGRCALDPSVFFGDFLFKKKVTRAPARKGFQACPKAQPRSDTPTERPT